MQFEFDVRSFKSEKLDGEFLAATRKSLREAPEFTHRDIKEHFQLDLPHAVMFIEALRKLGGQ